MEVGTIGGTVESASTVVLAEKTIPIIPTPPATPSPLAPPAGTGGGVAVVASSGFPRLHHIMVFAMILWRHDI